jgi:two-component system, chemotaxis family, response regulator Rcp1
MKTINQSKILDILLVEDAKSDAYLTQETLSESNIPHQIHWVKNGVEAIDFLKQQGDYAEAPRPDLILLDLNLPKKNGREVLTYIKRDENSADERDILGSYQLQASCYLVKPLNLDNFIALIKSIACFWLTAVTYPAKL